MYLSESLPQVNVVSTKLVPTGGADGATHELRVTVENQGRIPTALEQAKEVKIVRPDTVEVELPEGTGEVVGDAPEFFLDGNQRRIVSVRLKLTQPQGRYDAAPGEHARRRRRALAAVRLAGRRAAGGGPGRRRPRTPGDHPR